MTHYSTSGSPRGVGAKPWIMMRTDLWDDPRVCRLCELLDESEAMVIGGLYRLWSIGDAHSVDGYLHGMSAAALDRRAGISGLADALASVGWLIVDDDGITIPDFDVHNGTSAKRRAQAARRQQKKRQRHSAVTQESRSERDNSVTRTDKSREDYQSPEIRIPDADADASESGPSAEVFRIPCVRESLAMRIQPAKSPGPLKDGVYRPLKDTHISDSKAMVEWFRRQLAASSPVLDGDRAHLLLTLAASMHAASLPKNAIQKSRVALFIAIVSKGRWHECAHCIDEADQWLVEHYHKETDS